MIQQHFHYDSLDKAISHLSNIRNILKTTEHKDALLHIFTAGISTAEAQNLLTELDRQLPDVKRVGVAIYKFSSDTGKPLIACNIVISKDTEFHVLQYSCTPGKEHLTATQFLDACSTIQQIKAIELFPVNPELDVTEFLNTVSEKYEDIPVFGAIARPSDAVNNSFAIGKDLLFSGFTAVLCSSPTLEVYMDYILGWNPIGREMPISKVERNPQGGCTVHLIDGQPAADIYKKYLGIEWNGDITENVWAFPLMVMRNNVNLCFFPIASNNGALHFAAPLYEKEKIRFSYCTREQILEASLTGSERMQIFSPEAVLISLCVNRAFFLQDDAHLEWIYYRQHNPQLAYCHGYGEISLQNKKGGVLSSAFVALGMREGNNMLKQAAQCPMPQQTGFAPRGKIPLSYLVSHFFHEMTNELVHFQKYLESEVEKKTRENERLSLHVVETLAQAIDAKDTYTNGHSSRVAKYSVEIGRRAGYSDAQLGELYMISLLHDVGKIGVPDQIINKPTKLTDEEYAIIKNHPVMGAHILQEIKEMPKLTTGARWHHERYDGKGYPDGLKGNNIPEEARIIAVADAYDAMTSNRSYRKKLSQSFVRGEVEKGKGSQFDPRFADIMLTMIDEDTAFQMTE